jgi:energy-coupling factor transport system ATP-binding protein
VVNNDGTISHGSPAQQLARFSFVPPLIELAQQLKWQPIELSIESAKTRFAAEQWSSARKIAHLELGKPLLEAKDVDVNYGELRAVDGVSFSAHQGEVIAVMGENGSGKTSLLWALHGLDPRLETVAMVPQQAADLLFLNSLSEELRDSDEVAQAPMAATAALLEQFSGRLDPAIHPRDLSSGQQLSLVLAMQLVKNAPLVLLDEPTRGLDYATKKQVAQVLRNLAADGKAIVFASHDVEFVAQAADRVIQLEAGKVIADEPVELALGNRPGNSLASQIAQITGIDGVIALQQVIDLD